MFRIDAQYVGRKVKCPKCATIMVVPAEPVATNETVPVRIATSEPSISARIAQQRANRSLTWMIVVVGVVGLGATFGTLALLRWFTSRPATVVIRLREDVAEDVAVLVDGRQYEFGEATPISLQVAAGTRRLTVKRRGYPPHEEVIEVHRGQQVEISPVWDGKSEGELAGVDVGESVIPRGYEDWFQDWEKAKQVARDLQRTIVVAFVMSDVPGDSQTLHGNLFAAPEFQEWARENVVLCVVDFPQTTAGEQRVADYDGNQRRAINYRVSRLPTLLWVDAEGRPLGRRTEVHDINWPAFQTLHADVQQKYADFQAALRESDGPDNDEQRLRLAVQAVQWIMEQGFGDSYLSELKRLAVVGRELDRNNLQGKQELLFAAAWEVRVNEALANRRKSECLELVREVNDWRGMNEIKDTDLAVRVHLLAAGVLADCDDLREAGEEVAAAAKLTPTSAALAARLQAAIEIFSGTLATGTGFIVASGGYVVTNNHVVSVGKTVKVRLSEKDDAVEATIVGRDAENDLALLKLDDPRAAALPAVGVLDIESSRGVAVATLGFPLGSEMGQGLKLTQGTISSLPDKAAAGMYLLDMRINPGNSGGPLCDNKGQIIGIVTAKSLSDADVESYGMAVPARTLVTFLTRHIPGFTAAMPSDAGGVDWAQVDRRVSPSVVMVITTE